MIKDAPGNPARVEIEERTTSPARPIDRKCVAVILVLTFLQAFNSRFQLGPDGISYLDVGDAWLRGDIAAGVNGYWNPILPILLAFASRVFGNPLAEPLIAHLLNFAVVGLNLFLFGRLLRQIRAFRANQGEIINGASDNLFSAIAYLLFLWCHVDLINLVNITPDFLVTSSVLVCATCLIRLLQSDRPILSAVGLGAALGLGYLVKAIMFVAAPFFILAALFCAPRLTKGLKNALVATAVFGIISAPYVWLLSRQQGHLTYSEAGKLAYAWMVNKTRPWMHWQGDEPGTGTPQHPTRRLLMNPEVFEFGDRPGTYPPWFDPTYWHAGLKVTVEPKNQLKAINTNLQLYYSVFFEEAVSVLILFLVGAGVFATARKNGSAITKIWPLLIPALAGLCVYVPVYAMSRHLAPFVLLLFLAFLVSTWRSIRALLPERVLMVAIACGLLPTVLSIGGETLKANFFKRSELTEQRRVAVALKEFGLKPGERIAVVGRACDAVFARLAGLKIVAEAYREADETPLWARLPEAELRTIEALKKVEASAIIRDTPSAFDSTLNWKTIPGTRFSVLLTGQRGAKQ